MTLKQIHSVVRDFLSSSFDTENIACELWLEAWMRKREGCQICGELRFSADHGGTQGQFPKMHDFVEFTSIDPPLSREIIHNRCVDELRKRSTEKKNVGRTVEPHDDSIDQASEKVSKLMSCLSSHHQLFIFERFYLNLSVRQIAKRLNVTEQNVSACIHSALEQLRAEARRIENAQ